MGRTRRTFLALGVPDEVRDEMAALQDRLRRVEPNLRIVAPRNMHLTVKFVGEWGEDRLAELCAAARRAAAKVKPFPLLFRGVDAFPHVRRPRVIVLHCESAPDGALGELHRALEGELAGVGIRPEGRPFKPHLTVARVKGRAGKDLAAGLRSLSGFLGGEGEAEALGVFLSELTPGGPIYTKADLAPLGGHERP
ncbi:MAG: RNA 2',3'-cyclic phosphodiesterase [Planctomycetota bacterium]|jgi:2'-5' RNA ligase